MIVYNLLSVPFCSLGTLPVTDSQSFKGPKKSGCQQKEITQTKSFGSLGTHTSLRNREEFIASTHWIMYPWIFSNELEQFSNI